MEGSSRSDQSQVVLLVAPAAAWSSAMMAWRALGEPASRAWSATSSVVLTLLRRCLARQISPGDMEQFAGPWPTLDGAWGLGRASVEEVRLFLRQSTLMTHDTKRCPQDFRVRPRSPCGFVSLSWLRKLTDASHASLSAAFHWRMESCYQRRISAWEILSIRIMDRGFLRLQ